MNIYHLPQCLWAGTQGWLIQVVLSQGSHEVTVKLLVKAASSEAWTRAGRSTSEVAAYTPGQLVLYVSGRFLSLENCFNDSGTGGSWLSPRARDLRRAKQKPHIKDTSLQKSRPDISTTSPRLPSQPLLMWGQPHKDMNTSNHHLGGWPAHIPYTVVQIYRPQALRSPLSLSLSTTFLHLLFVLEKEQGIHIIQYVAFLCCSKAQSGH